MKTEQCWGLLSVVVHKRRTVGETNRLQRVEGIEGFHLVYVSY